MILIIYRNETSERNNYLSTDALRRAQDVDLFLDPFHFAYKDDAINNITHWSVLLVDFSSTFYTLELHLFIQKLK